MKERLKGPKNYGNSLRFLNHFILNTTVKLYDFISTALNFLKTLSHCTIIIIKIN